MSHTHLQPLATFSSSHHVHVARHRKVGVLICGRTMAAKNLSDEELRRRLEKLGVRPGPITDSTRALYLSKLKHKTGNRKKQSHEPPSGNGAHTAQNPSVVSHALQQDFPQSSELSCMPPPVTQLHGSTTVEEPPAMKGKTSDHFASRAQGNNRLHMLDTRWSQKPSYYIVIMHREVLHAIP